MVTLTIDDDGNVSSDDPNIEATVDMQKGIMTIFRKNEDGTPVRTTLQDADGKIAGYFTVEYPITVTGGRNAKSWRPPSVPGQIQPKQFKRSLLANRNEGLEKIRQKHRRTK